MTRDEFLNELMHEVDGWMMDVWLTSRSGKELSIFLRSIRARARSKAAELYDSLAKSNPPKPAAPAYVPQTNGKPNLKVASP